MVACPLLELSIQASSLTLSSPAPVLPCFQATPQLLNFSNAPSPRGGSKPWVPYLRVVIEPWHLSSLPLPVLPTRMPISHCTHSRAQAPLALFTAGQPLHKYVTYHIPTAKSVWAPAEPIGFAGLCKAMQPAENDKFAYLCQALMHVSGPEALLVLNPSTGKFLEHCQLHHDPHYKATWDTSYANELGQLCQGISTSPYPNTKWVADINTFFPIDFHDIPFQKRMEICHTMVVCEVRPEKDDPDCTRITISSNHICFPGDMGTNIASLEVVKLLLNSILSCPGTHFSFIDLKNFYLDTPMPDLEYFCIKIDDIRRNSLRSTTFKVAIVMGGSTLTFAKTVMDCPRLAFLPTISSNSASC
jgi:hypothetical protein